MLTDILTGPLRRNLYIAFALSGVAIGATQVGYASAKVGQPIALTVTLAVYAFLGTAFGFTASANVPSVPEPQGKHEAGPLDVSGHTSIPGTTLDLGATENLPYDR